MTGNTAEHCTCLAGVSDQVHIALMQCNIKNDNIKNDLSGRIVREGSAIPSSMEASLKKHRPHIKVGKDAEEEDIAVMYLLMWVK